MKSLMSIDKILILFGSVAFIISGYLILDYGGQQETNVQNKNESIADLIRLKNDVRRKYKQNISWTNLEKPNKVFNLDQIYTGDDSAALIKFNDGTDIKIASNTLIVVTNKADHNELELLKGTVFHKVEKGKKLVFKSKKIVSTIKGDNSLVKLTKTKNNDIKITVLKGKVNVKKAKEVVEVAKIIKTQNKTTEAFEEAPVEEVQLEEIIEEVVMEAAPVVEQGALSMEEMVAIEELEAIDNSLGIESIADESTAMLEEDVVLAFEKEEKDEPVMAEPLVEEEPKLEEPVVEEEPEVIEEPVAVIKEVPVKKIKPVSIKKKTVKKFKAKEKSVVDEPVDEDLLDESELEKEVVKEEIADEPEVERVVYVEEEKYKLPAWETSMDNAMLEVGEVFEGEEGDREPSSKSLMKNQIKKKSHYFTYLGYSARSFKQGSSVDLDTTTIDFIFNYRNILLPPKWHIDLDFKTSLAQLNKGNRPESVYFIDTDIRVGYAFDFLKEPYKFMLMGGVYSSSMIVQDSAFGYQTLFYPQIYPSVRRLFHGGKTLNVYLKLMPLGSAQEYAMSVGGRWRVPSWWKFNALSYGVEYNSLNYIESSTEVKNSSYNINVGVGF